MTSATTTTAFPHQTSPSARAWQRFRRNRLGFGSLIIFMTLFILSLGAEFLSNDKPLVVRFEGQWYFPVVQTLPEQVFGGDFETPADYLDPFIQQQLHKGSNCKRPTLTTTARSTTLPPCPTPRRQQPATGWAPMTGGVMCWRVCCTAFGSRYSLLWH
jgi:microcin C transport system permease protein